MRIVHGQPPAASGVHDGLAWARFDPAGPATGAVVILPGAGSVKESHHDFARCCAADGLVGLCFDARGHGESGGALDGRAIADVAQMADVARAAVPAPDPPLALRGSSMGGYFAIVAAGPARADAVVAICPAPGQLLRRGLEAGRLDFPHDADALHALLDVNDLEESARRLTCPLLLLHAQADESVPVESSRELEKVAPDCRYVELPGGHHRSIQHDAELQGVAVRFVSRAFRRRS